MKIAAANHSSPAKNIVQAALICLMLFALQGNAHADGNADAFDEAVRAAMAARSTGDTDKSNQLLLSAAELGPEKAFISKRLPYGYLQSWEVELPPDPAHLSIRSAGNGLFYSIVLDGQSVRGITRIDSNSRDLRRIQIDEDKADFASSLSADIHGRFYLANFAITFSFDSDGTYLGQVVTMHRHKSRAGNTLLWVLDCGDYYISDFHNFVGRMNQNADTIAYMQMNDEESSSIHAFSADKDSLLYVAKTGENIVAVLTPDMKQKITFGGVGAGPGQSYALIAIAASKDAVAIVDSVLRRMQILDKNGAYLVEMPSSAHSIAMDDNGTIMALDGNRLVCYERFYPAVPAETDDDFARYLRAVELLEGGNRNEATPLLERLVDNADTNLAQVAGNLLVHGTVALARHHQAPRPLSEAEIARLLGEPVAATHNDPHSNDLWAVLDGGFVVRIHPDERFDRFDTFLKLISLRDINVTGVMFDESWIWASSTAGRFRYSRATGDWQLLPEP